MHFFCCLRFPSFFFFRTSPSSHFRICHICFVFLFFVRYHGELHSTASWGTHCGETCRRTCGGAMKWRLPCYFLIIGTAVANFFDLPTAMQVVAIYMLPLTLCCVIYMQFSLLFLILLKLLLLLLLFWITCYPMYQRVCFVCVCALVEVVCGKWI
uniref:Uncharacterized protein TCIL3000_2_760 n=1 Tax=Trypanosoma congolense (strain IL3000) TaxID=1068625 RepID=G0UJE7_TRYCI|nr:unnamed protein product [Trypanosoma congolense IL3000]